MLNQKRKADEVIVSLKLLLITFLRGLQLGGKIKSAFALFAVGADEPNFILPNVRIESCLFPTQMPSFVIFVRQLKPPNFYHFAFGVIKSSNRTLALLNRTNKLTEDKLRALKRSGFALFGLRRRFVKCLANFALIANDSLGHRYDFFHDLPPF